MGSEITGYQQDAEKIIVRLENGREISGDVLLGADGIQSTIRAQMGAAGTPNFTGNTAWRVLVPLDALGSLAPKPTACVWMGRGRHAVTYQLYGGEVANFVGVVERSDWTRESWIERGNPGDALSDFSGWHPVITTLLKDAELGTLFRWALFDRPPLARWTDGRAALLGDAAHPMLPFLAQGAAMAVEDGWVLARELSSPGRPVDVSLLAYQNQRSARTGKAQARSRANMKTFHQRTKLGQLATYGPMWLAGQFAPILVHKRMDWLYGYDVTQD